MAKNKSSRANRAWNTKSENGVWVYIYRNGRAWPGHGRTSRIVRSREWGICTKYIHMKARQGKGIA